MVARNDLEQTLHRLANNVECQLARIFEELLAESRTEAVHNICWHGCRFIETLREVRDSTEGGEE